jgi:hypothetical protein
MPLLVKLVQALAWPLVALMAILFFKEQIKDLLDRLQSFGVKDYALGFGSAAPDKEQPPVDLEKLAADAKLHAPPPAATDKPATLFWLANDLMWLQDMLLRGAPAKPVLAAIKNLRTYVKRLGLSGSLADNELARIAKIGEAAIKEGPVEWSPEFRLQIARQVESVKWFIAARAQENESGFKKLRVFPSRK